MQNVCCYFCQGKYILVSKIEPFETFFNSLQTPSRVEPVLADKEVLLTALNIKAMSFSGSGDGEDESEDDDMEEDENAIKANGGPRNRKRKNSIVEQLKENGGSGIDADDKANKPKKPVIAIIVDLAFSTNVRFLDDHELYLDNVELYRVSRILDCCSVVLKRLEENQF